MSEPIDPRETADLLEVDPIEPGAELRRRVLAAVDPRTRFEGFVARFARLFDLGEERAREILTDARTVEASGWVDAPVAGVRFYHFRGGERVVAADCGLVQLAPGTVFPRHRHLGEEWTLALSGIGEEDTGELWLPGDLTVREAGSVHGYRAAGDEPYLFAVVLHGGIEIRGS
jgi:quercetin dioxygenase-like cupin family protein